MTQSSSAHPRTFRAVVPTDAWNFSQLILQEAGTDLFQGLIAVVVCILIINLILENFVYPIIFWEIVLFAILIIAIVVLPPIFNIVFQENREDAPKYWIVEYQERLVAYAMVNKYSTHAVIRDVFVAADWRRQGMGSYLMQNLIQQTDRPLYLLSLAGTVRFYTRLNFVQITVQQVPPSILRTLNVVLGIESRVGDLSILVCDPNNREEVAI